MYSVRENVSILTAWHEYEEAKDGVLRDIRDGTMYRQRFLDNFGDSKYNICISLSADGVQKSGLSEKTVFPVVLRVESISTNVKSDDNLRHMVALVPGNYKNLNHFLAPIAAELHMLRTRGIDVDIAGYGTHTVRVAVVLINADLRAIQSLGGKYRDPAIQYACPNCTIEGTRHGHNRTIYKESKKRTRPYAQNDSLGARFKFIPVLGYGIPFIEDSLAICFGHNVKNGLRRIFGAHGDVGSDKFVQKLRDLEPRGRFPAGSTPWLVNAEAVNAFEVRIIHSLWSLTPKSPFQNKKGISISALKAKEIHHGISELRQDRRMIDYIRMLRSGLCELAIRETVPRQYANTTNKLLRAISDCLKESYHVGELDKLKVYPLSKSSLE